MNVSIGFNLQVTATPGFHSLYDWCFQTMWLFSRAPEDPQDETVMEMHGADARYSVVKSVMHAIRTQDEHAQWYVADQMIHIAKLWTIRGCSESTLGNWKLLVWIPKENAHLVDLEWTEEEQTKLKTLVERYNSQGASGAWRVHRWPLTFFPLELGDTEDWNYISRLWYNEWPLDTWVDSPIIQWLGESFLPMLVKEPAEYPEPDKDEASNETLLHKLESDKSLLLCAPLP
jgi:hypothetical protein